MGIFDVLKGGTAEKAPTDAELLQMQGVTSDTLENLSNNAGDEE